MIKIAHFSKADSVKGQGVGSAYVELIHMLKSHFPNELSVTVNDYSPSDISHYHTINPQYLVSALQREKRGIRVGYVHFLPDTLIGSIKLPDPIQKLFTNYVLKFYRTMDELVTVNPIFIKDIVAYGFPEERITYIPNFVSSENFYPKSEESKLDFRIKHLIPEETFVVLGVGQIQKRKGIDDFLTIASEHPDKLFVWVGGFSFGQITDGYERYKAIYENPPKNIRFTGIVDREEIVDWYNIANVFLLPSYNELFPMSILEAFSCHTPVLVRDLPLYRDVIDGFYASGLDAESMSKEIEKLAKSSDYYTSYYQAATAGANTYSEDYVANLWYNYYQGLIKKYR